MELREYLKSHPHSGQFRIKPVYSKIGNMIEVNFTDEPGYAEQLAPEVTVIRSFKTKQIVGCKIANVLHLVGKAETECQHEWVDPSNRVVEAEGYTLCLKCRRLKEPEEKVA